MVTLRAFEIILFILLLQASIVFVGNIDLFEGDDYMEYSAMADNEYSTWNITGELSEYSVGEEASAWDYFSASVTFLIDGLIMFFKIIFSIVFIYPTLVKVFGLPWELSALLQVGIVTIYIWGLMQYKSGKSTKMMD